MTAFLASNIPPHILSTAGTPRVLSESAPHAVFSLLMLSVLLGEAFSWSHGPLYNGGVLLSNLNEWYGLGYEGYALAGLQSKICIPGTPCAVLPSAVLGQTDTFFEATKKRAE
jgi:hypothetical protein